MTRARKKGNKAPASSCSPIKLPSRNDIITFINENPSLSGKREIAKAFNLKGDSRIWLKDLLRDLTVQGVIEKRKKTLVTAGRLPPVTTLTIIGRDKDGGFIAKLHGESSGKDIIVAVHPSRREKSPSIGVGDTILAKIFPSKDKSGPDYTARPIRKIERQKNTRLGVLRKLDDGSWRLESIERGEGEIKLDTTAPIEANSGDLVEVEMTQNNRYGLKRGKIREVLGHIDSEKALSMIAIITHDIPYVFDAETLNEADKAKGATMDHREDWRALPLITIDPADAKDHDDAVFAQADDDTDNIGGFIVTVAIADVAYYIKTGSTMDHEALKRSNSVYFPDRVVPMLPERISNNLCSLREGEERPALAVRMVFDSQGNKRTHKFYRIMMKSAAKLSYQQAQSAIDGLPDDKTAPIVETILKPLWAAYAAMKMARSKRAPLELDLPEKKIVLDENGRVKDVIVPPRLDAHRLIEECMIQANVCAAETLKKLHQPLIYRIHDQPSMAKQESLRDFLHSLGMSLARGVELTPAKMNNILAKVENTPQQELVNQVVLRSQSQAEYSPDNIGHFGLNLINYAHFTSPIRRYADLIVHRALIRALHLGDDGLTDQQQNELAEIAGLISGNERRAMTAERQTVDRLIAHYLADKIGAQFNGRIAGVTKSGLFVSLDKFGADGFIPISTLADDYYHFDEKRHSLIGEKTRKGYQLGDIVTIRLIEAQPVAGALRFEMLTQPQKLPFSPVSHHKSGAGKHNRRNGRKGRR